MTSSRLGTYELIESLHQGGLAEVFLARQVGQAAPTPITVKRLDPAAVADPKRGAHITARAREATVLRHPNILRILEVGADAGVPFVATEYLAGRPLRALLGALAKKKERLERPLALLIASRICEALAHAHATAGGQGVVHAAVSPDSIRVGLSGEVKLEDYGFMPATWNQRSVSKNERLGFLSPEQMAGGPVTGATDLYALGLVLYELVMGRRLYGPAPRALRLQELLDGAALPLGDDLPEALGDLLRKVLARQPEERFQSAQALLEALGRIEDASSEGAGTSADLAALMARMFPDAHSTEAQRQTRLVKGPPLSMSSPSSPRSEDKASTSDAAVEAVSAKEKEETSTSGAQTTSSPADMEAAAGAKAGPLNGTGSSSAQAEERPSQDAVPSPALEAAPAGAPGAPPGSSGGRAETDAAGAASAKTDSAEGEVGDRTSAAPGEGAAAEKTPDGAEASTGATSSSTSSQAPGSSASPRGGAPADTATDTEPKGSGSDAEGAVASGSQAPAPKPTDAAAPSPSAAASDSGTPSAADPVAAATGEATDAGNSGPAAAAAHAPASEAPKSAPAASASSTAPKPASAAQEAPNPPTLTPVAPSASSAPKPSPSAAASSSAPKHTPVAPSASSAPKPSPSASASSSAPKPSPSAAASSSAPKPSPSAAASSSAPKPSPSAAASSSAPKLTPVAPSASSAPKPSPSAAASSSAPKLTPVAPSASSAPKSTPAAPQPAGSDAAKPLPGKELTASSEVSLPDYRDFDDDDDDEDERTQLITTELLVSTLPAAEAAAVSATPAAPAPTAPPRKTAVVTRPSSTPRATGARPAAGGPSAAGADAQRPATGRTGARPAPGDPGSGPRRTPTRPPSGEVRAAQGVRRTGSRPSINALGTPSTSAKETRQPAQAGSPAPRETPAGRGTGRTQTPGSRPARRPTHGGMPAVGAAKGAPTPRTFSASHPAFDAIKEAESLPSARPGAAQPKMEILAANPASTPEPGVPGQRPLVPVPSPRPAPKAPVRSAATPGGSLLESVPKSLWVVTGLILLLLMLGLGFSLRSAPDSEVVVNVTPAQGALVTLDGRQLQSGVPIALPPGEYELVAIAEGFKRHSQRITVFEGAEQAVYPITLEPDAGARGPVPTGPGAENAGTFTVRFTTSTPGVEIWVEGTSIGTAPEATAILPIGRPHRYEARAKGFEATMGTVGSFGDSEVTVQLTLQPAVDRVRNPNAPPTGGTGRLVVATEPNGAEVYVNGVPTGRRTPITSVDPLTLPVGKHRLRFAHGDRVSRLQNVTLERGQTILLDDVAIDQAR